MSEQNTARLSQCVSFLTQMQPSVRVFEICP